MLAFVLDIGDRVRQAHWAEEGAEPEVPREVSSSPDHADQAEKVSNFELGSSVDDTVGLFTKLDSAGSLQE